jgi:hypothetical protein
MPSDAIRGYLRCAAKTCHVSRVLGSARLRRRNAISPAMRRHHDHRHRSALIQLRPVALVVQLSRHLTLFRHVVQNLLGRLHSVDASRNTTVGCSMNDRFTDFQF